VAPLYKQNVFSDRRNRLYGKSTSLRCGGKEENSWKLSQPDFLQAGYPSCHSNNGIKALNIATGRAAAVE